MKDEMLESLLLAALKQRKLQELVYKRNKFFDRSLEALKLVLELKPPQNLIELRLVDCNSSPEIMQDLIQNQILIDFKKKVEA